MRAAELRDEIVFKQPESSHLGDCPICCLPLAPSIDEKASPMMACCSKIICNGCNIANQIREVKGKLLLKCPYCRHQLPQSQEEAAQIRMKRVEVNDPVAIWRLGVRCRREGDYESAFQHYKKAAELGNADAHYNVSCVYRDGEGVEKDKKKEVYHLEEAAIGGNPYARHNLAIVEGKSGRYERAMKHDIVAANLGHDISLEHVIEGFKAGVVSKEDFAATLRAHQAALDATKSAQREEAEAGRRVM